MTNEQQGTAKPIYRRWWFIALAVVLLLGFLGSLVEDDEGDPVAAETTTTASTGEQVTTTEVTTTTEPPPTTSTTQSPTTTTTQLTTTTQPTTTTTAPPVEGSGDDFIAFSVAGDQPAVLDISYSGGSNFAIHTYDASNEPIDLLVNEIGSYQGRVPVNFRLGEDVAFIEITASGPWTIQTVMLSELEVQAGTVAGTGDDVVIMNVSSPTMDVSHTGSSNFAVHAYTDSVDLLVNEIGNYSGTVRSPTGNVVFEISADGEWSLAEA